VPCVPLQCCSIVLKQAGIYDTTLILVAADHGVNPGNFKSDLPGSREQWLHRGGAANPVFLLKPLHAGGPLLTTGEPVYLPDVGATLCVLSGACTIPSGIPAGTAPPSRLRRFNHYQWRHRFWTLQQLPGITSYDVSGPLNDQASWAAGKLKFHCTEGRRSCVASAYSACQKLTSA
jgi:hypothetical protein